ncbi:MAG: AraC family transcriptional regulator [Lachnospiraceae bacterium]|nr:AraC family transcriptional regulator [Lachnospiraceae bacterium]
MSEIRFEPLFQYIEANLHRKISLSEAARAALFSPAHLTRLFQFAYGMTPAEYIRRRRLTESVAALQEDSKTVLEIALDFGFGHEQSFTRAFRAEFGITPGKYRAERKELPILLPIQDYGVTCSGGRLFGPEAVYLPEIRLLGTWHDIPYRNSARLAPAAALDFWDNERPLLPGGREADIYYGLTRHFQDGRSYSRYLTAIETLSDAGTVHFGGCPCIKFHYIGKHHYRELSQQTASRMYRVIRKYVFSKNALPGIGQSVHLEKINLSEFDGEYCLLEWFAPLSSAALSPSEAPGKDDEKSSARKSARKL